MRAELAVLAAGVLLLALPSTGCDDGGDDATCGNAIVESGELCDDGAANSDVSPDACRSNCMNAWCGDGVRDTGEECDDANTVDSDDCRNDCSRSVLATCGNGAVDPGEECDNGEANSDSDADACRTNCVSSYCGDSVTDSGEDCDDGNGIDDDSCPNDCSHGAGGFCGNGVVDEGEDCDDGNEVETDDCLGSCRAASCGDGVVHTGVEVCDDGNDDDTDACTGECAAARCGDGFVQVGIEGCDDGNEDDSDACPSSCAAARCGDGFVQAGVEECDDGNAVDNDSCLNACVPARCGDGILHLEVEQCDDGNDADTDACLGTCELARCGDGVVRIGVEQCDDGNFVNTDGCLVTCLPARCGDGFVHAGVEMCDDGNSSNTDSCLNTCDSASCGDGLVHMGVEECDDGDADDTDDCPSSCVVAHCGDGFLLADVEICDDGNDSNADACLATCVEASCGDGFTHEGVEECDDANEDNTDSCIDTCMTAVCGDGHVLAEVELCDEGEDNGAPELAACSETCGVMGRYEHVLSMSAEGEVTFGDWESAFDRVAGNLEECLLRFDGRMARPEYIEYTAPYLRFDFQPLHAWHSSWDAYGFILLEPGTRAGLGAAYRDGRSAASVWRRSRDQHPDASWQPMPVDLYCERETAYEHVATFDSAGTATFGSWDELYEAAVTNAARCKVRFDIRSESEARVHPIPHVEWGDGWMNLDFQGLHARHDAHDAYGYVSITPGARAGIGGSYHRGTWGPGAIQAHDRVQHSESDWVPMTVEVYCADIFNEVWEINPDGTMAAGDWGELFATVSSEVRDCRIAYDSRVSDPMHVEYSTGYLEFDFMNLHGYHDSWDSFALVDINHETAAGVRSSFRSGNRGTVWMRTASQHRLHDRTATPVRVHCEDESTWRRVLSVERSGLVTYSSREAFFEDMTANEWGYECKIRFGWRVTRPVYVEHSGEDLLFDYLGLSAYHNGWDAYASSILPPEGPPGIAGTYRQGHADNVWRHDRAQHSLDALHVQDFDFFCR